MIIYTKQRGSAVLRTKWHQNLIKHAQRYAGPDTLWGWPMTASQGRVLIYGELDAGQRTRRGQQKRCKDVLRATLKSCGMPHNTWEATTTYRVLWRCACHATCQSCMPRGPQDYEEKRYDTLIWRDWDGRLSSLDTFVCHVCGRNIVHHGSACIATTEDMLLVLTGVEIRLTDASIHTMVILGLLFPQGYATVEPMADNSPSHNWVHTELIRQ